MFHVAVYLFQCYKEQFKSHFSHMVYKILKHRCLQQF